jgi:hypothetical protein
MSDSDIQYRFVVTAFLKGMCFVIPLLLISVALKSALPYACESVPCVEGLSNQKDQTTFYFIGTSRVQRAISPSTLKGDLPDYNFVNLGLSSSSFLYSCQTASNVIKNTPGKKIIFIELTGVSLTPPDSYYYLLTSQNVAEVFKQHMSFQLSLGDVRALTFFSFSIHGDIKKTIYPRLKLNAGPAIGFLQEKRDGGSLASMLTKESFTVKTNTSPEALNMYLEVINNLRKEAEENGDEIQFILPLMIAEESEFNIDMSVFAELPEEMKWSYTDEFLISMRNGQYLSDQSHLNSKGADIYSHELSEFIRKRFAGSSN